MNVLAHDMLLIYVDINLNLGVRNYDPTRCRRDKARRFGPVSFPCCTCSMMPSAKLERELSTLKVGRS